MRYYYPTLNLTLNPTASSFFSPCRISHWRDSFQVRISRLRSPTLESAVASATAFSNAIFSFLELASSEPFPLRPLSLRTLPGLPVRFATVCKVSENLKRLELYLPLGFADSLGLVGLEPKIQLSFGASASLGTLEFTSVGTHEWTSVGTLVGERGKEGLVSVGE